MTGRVVVTGAAGKLGRAVVRDLAQHGWDVLAVDRTPVEPEAGGEGREVASVVLDLTDHGSVLAAVAGHIDERGPAADAVVHLAAFPAPGLRSNAETFANNAVTTWNVFEACRVSGVKRVVWASSETVLGLPFDTPPPYAPVDEEYHPRPESTYSLNKTLEEEMAHQFCRWDDGLTMVGLRFSNVMDPEDYEQFPSFDADPMLRKWNLWGYIDARDGAQAVRRALEWDGRGREVFVIANADTVMSRSSASLMAEVYPDVEIRRELGEHETLLCIDKARRVLGYDPQHSWRDHAFPSA